MIDIDALSFIPKQHIILVDTYDMNHLPYRLNSPISQVTKYQIDPYPLLQIPPLTHEIRSIPLKVYLTSNDNRKTFQKNEVFPEMELFNENKLRPQPISAIISKRDVDEVKV